MQALQIEWRPRDVPLDARAVIARGEGVNELAAAAESRIAQGAELRASRSADSLLVMTSSTAALPWSDGVTYLAHEQGVLLPTTLAPTVPIDWIRAALRRKLGQEALLVLIPGLVLHGMVPADSLKPGDLVTNL